MSFKKRRVEGLVADADHPLENVGLGAAYGRVFGFVARNYASSAKAAAGTDTAMRVELKDGNGDVFFLDAADRDYATAEVTLALHLDATVTGLGITPVDSTGAAVTGAAGDNPIASVPVVKSPITVRLINGGTATDFFSIDLLVEI